MDELHQTGTPRPRRELAKGIRVEIDDPENRRIHQPAGLIRGWFAAFDAALPKSFEFSIGGLVLPHRVVKRQDVEEVLPEHLIVGFDIPYDLTSYLAYVDDSCLAIELKLPDYDSITLKFRIEAGAMAACLADAGGV